MIFDEISRAFGYLMIAGIIIVAHNIARDNTKNGELKINLWKGFLWCGVLALFASITLGSSTCEDIYNCEEYTGNSYEPTNEQRIANFAYFITLLYIPTIIGTFTGNKKNK